MIKASGMLCTNHSINELEILPFCCIKPLAYRKKPIFFKMGPTFGSGKAEMLARTAPHNEKP